MTESHVGVRASELDRSSTSTWAAPADGLLAKLSDRLSTWVGMSLIVVVGGVMLLLVGRDELSD